MATDYGRSPLRGSGHSAKPEPKVSALRASVLNADPLADAIELACQFHRGQVDKAGAPYILHPIRVMLAVQGEDRQIAAVLHDAVEDGGLEVGLVAFRFGDRIGEAVDALSRREGESYADFIGRCGANDIARDVKRADLTDNMNLSRLPNPTSDDVKRAQKYREARVRLNVIASRHAIPTRSAET
jgi:hypothetical protein